MTFQYTLKTKSFNVRGDMYVNPRWIHYVDIDGLPSGRHTEWHVQTIRDIDQLQFESLLNADTSVLSFTPGWDEAR